MFSVEEEEEEDGGGGVGVGDVASLLLLMAVLPPRCGVVPVERRFQNKVVVSNGEYRHHREGLSERPWFTTRSTTKEDDHDGASNNSNMRNWIGDDVIWTLVLGRCIGVLVWYASRPSPKSKRLTVSQADPTSMRSWTGSWTMVPYRSRYST